MRRLIGAVVTAALFILLVTLPVAAADKGGYLTPPRVEEPPPGPLWNRTGAYVGLVGGYNSAQLQAEDFKFGETAALGGAMAGFNVRLDGVVLGLEGDYLLTNIKGSVTDGVATVQADTRFLASLRARAGLPVGPALLYATAGAALTEHKVTASDGMGGTSVSKDLLVGLVVGAGIEAELTRTLFVRLEGLHYIFPDKSLPIGSSFFESKDQQTTVRFGIGFKLN
jgi:outer membrane immunogenic protein